MRFPMHKSVALPILIMQEQTPDGFAEFTIEINGRILATTVMPVYCTKFWLNFTWPVDVLKRYC